MSSSGGGMNQKEYVGYVFFLFTMFVNIVTVVYAGFRSAVFLQELFLATVFVILSGAIIYGFYKDKQWSYAALAIFFAINLFNCVLLYFATTTYFLILLVLLNAVGFVIAVNKISEPSELLVTEMPAAGYDTQYIQPAKKPVTAKPAETQMIKHIEDFTKDIELQEEIKKDIPQILEPELEEMFRPYFDGIEQSMKKKFAAASREGEAKKFEWTDAKEWTNLRDKMANEIKELMPKPAKVKVVQLPGNYVASKAGKVYHTVNCNWAKQMRKASKVWFSTKKQAEKKGYGKHNCVK